MVIYEEDIEEVIELLINDNSFFGAIEKKRSKNMSYVLLRGEFEYRGLDIGKLLTMADIEIDEF